MKSVLAVVLAIALVGVATSASAQGTPNLTVYFQQGGQVASTACPGLGAITQIFVVANNLNSFISAIEYQILYPPAMTWLGDNFPAAPLVAGNSAVGVGLSFPIPQNGFNPLLIQDSFILWNCSDCSVTNIPVIVTKFPGPWPTPRAVSWPGGVSIPVVGMTSLICSTTNAETSTWGNVKAMFNN